MQASQEPNPPPVQTRPDNVGLTPQFITTCISIAETNGQDQAKRTCEPAGSKINFTFGCMSCDSDFDSREKLAFHECAGKKEGSNVLYECDACKTLYQSLEALQEHMKNHDETLAVLSPAVNTTFGYRNQYRCNLCDKFLCSKGSLVKHQQLHQGLKPYTCHFCEKSFSLKGNRDKHELIHGGEKPHRCGICAKSFTLKGNLQQHVLTHTSLKMYNCAICGREFTLKGNWSKHMKRHENGAVLREQQLEKKEREKQEKEKKEKGERKPKKVKTNKISETLKLVEEQLTEMESSTDETNKDNNLENEPKTEKDNEETSEPKIINKDREVKMVVMEVNQQDNPDNDKNIENVIMKLKEQGYADNRIIVMGQTNVENE